MMCNYSKIEKIIYKEKLNTLLNFMQAQKNFSWAIYLNEVVVLTQNKVKSKKIVSN
jgi:hypothetical protein